MANSPPVVQLTAATLDLKMRELRDQHFNETPFLNRLKGSVRRAAAGGRNLTTPIEYQGLHTGNLDQSGIEVGRYSPTSMRSFNLESDALITEASWAWAYYGGAVNIYPDEITQNKGPEQIVNLYEVRLQNVVKTMTDYLCTDLFELYSSYSANAVDGIDVAVEYRNGTKGGTAVYYGGINRGADGTTNTWWTAGGEYAYTNLSKATCGIDAATTKLSLSAMRTMKGLLRNKTTLIVCRGAEFDKYWSLLQPQERYRGDADLASAGFNSLMFETVPVTVDPYCGITVGSGDMYFLDMRTWQYWILGGRDFTTPNLVKPYDKDGLTGQSFWAGAIICVEPRNNGKFTTLAD